MLQKTQNFLEKYNIKNENIILAYSAGPDSTALALVLKDLSEKFNLNLTLAYFNHGWRELEAKKEEEFTRVLAKKLDADFIIGHAPKDVKKNEETARNLRYAFLSDCAKKFDSKRVLLAHNKDDNIETLLYRVIKGTSVKGLTSIPENRDIFYRPFLKVEKREILEFLEKRNQTFLLDSSNTDVKYKRNLIRIKILPLLAQINPSYINSIDNLIQNSIASKKIIDSSLEKIRNEVISDNKILRDKFLMLDSAFALEILNDYLFDFLKNRDFKTISKIYNFILQNADSQISINSDSFLKIKNNEIFILKRSYSFQQNDEIIIEKLGEYTFCGHILTIEKTKTPKGNFPPDESMECYLSFDFPLVLRKRKQGDIFSPFGLKNGKMKLKKYLINAKIPEQERDNLILLASGDEICWILGKKISENFKAKGSNCYKLTFKKG